MADLFCTLSNLWFSYGRQRTPLFRELSLTLPTGWTGVVGANGSGKSTLARLLTGELAPEQGSLRAPEPRYYCAQESGELPAGLVELLGSPGAEAHRTIRLLGLEEDWPYRWATLSFGERKRAQLASALFLDPALLALDEPTNHLDREAALRVQGALRGYRGIGLLISHDRDLLDALCERCIFIEAGGIVVRPGGVSAGLREAEREGESARREHEQAKEELARLRREARARRALADSAHARLSGRGLSAKDSDGRGKLRRARVSGKDAVGGKLLRQMESRIAAAEARLSESGAPPAQRLGITIAGAAARRDSFFRLDAGEIPLGVGRKLTLPALSMSPGDRIALTGPNGSGKSTLIRAIAAAARAHAVLYLPQELPRELLGSLRSRLSGLDSRSRGEVLSAVKRLGSEPERLLESARPSPGEARKLLLALALGEGSELILLDEPTNHMDLPSILCLEEALKACPSSLLFVTHDMRFAGRLASIRWSVEPSGEQPGRFLLHVR